MFQALVSDESDARNAYVNALSIGKGGIDAGRMSADLRTTCKKNIRAFVLSFVNCDR